MSPMPSQNNSRQAQHLTDRASLFIPAGLLQVPLPIFANLEISLAGWYLLKRQELGSLIPLDALQAPFYRRLVWVRNAAKGNKEKGSGGLMSRFL